MRAESGPGAMARRLFHGQQAPLNGTNGTNVTNVTAAISNPELGPVGKFLHEIGIPYYKPLGGAITFAIALFVLYTLGRVIVVPFVSRLLNRRGLDPHEKKPLVSLSKKHRQENSESMDSEFT